MPKSGAPTREKILDVAQTLVLNHGFGGTSIYRVIDGSGITKGTFFYHFKTKNHLARELIKRFHDNDLARFMHLMKQAQDMSTDPVRQLLIFVELLEEMLDQLTEPFPGCLIASFVYQSHQFDDETMCYCANSMDEMRDMCRKVILRILEKCTPRKPVDAEHLADLFVVILEGTFILSKTMKDPKLAAPPLRQYRQYLELLFLDS